MATASKAESIGGQADVDVDSCTLGQFVNSYNIPQTVAATRPFRYKLPSGKPVSIQTGDILLLRTVLTGSVALSYFDPETAYIRDVHLPVNFPGKFVVMNGKFDTDSISGGTRRPPSPPGHSTDAGNHGNPKADLTENPYENYVGKMYPRVQDLITDCPPFFKCTENFLDPIDPRVCFSAGDRFRTVKLTTDASGRKYLECKHMNGKLMKLPVYCKGQFQALQDKCFYTLSELISMAPIGRRLQLARDSLNGMYPIPGIRRDYVGDIYMHTPVSYVQVSPWKQLELTWNLPSDSSLRIQHYAVEEYETPVSHFAANRYTLTQFRIAYEDNFPVTACIQTYTDKPKVFAKYLQQRSPIVCVHKFDKVEKILAKCEEDHYVLSPTLPVKCIAVCRKFYYIGDLLKTRPGTKVTVREDVACDAPSPFCLHSGDVLNISSRTSYTVVNVNYKWNNSNHQVSVLKCDRLLSGKKTSQKVKIPLDLEVEMDEVLDDGRDQAMVFAEFLQSKPEFPVTVEFAVDEADCPRDLPRKLTLCCSIRDSCLYVSVRPQRASHKRNLSDHDENAILEVPERHLALMSFEQLLSIEEACIADRPIVRCEVEPISGRIFTEMESDDRSYETIGGHSLALPKKIPYR